MAEKEPEFLYVTTTGWKTGKPHEIEIWYVSYESAYYIVAEGREQAHWVQNIQHNPLISFRVGDKNFQGQGRVIDNAAEPALAAAVSAKMDEKYEWSDGLIVELRPD
jgi:deazaflavin-dependent oxidoreductase (nitroreductase family)